MKKYWNNKRENDQRKWENRVWNRKSLAAKNYQMEEQWKIFVGKWTSFCWPLLFFFYFHLSIIYPRAGLNLNIQCKVKSCMKLHFEQPTLTENDYICIHTDVKMNFPCKMLDIFPIINWSFFKAFKHFQREREKKHWKLYEHSVEFF